MALRAQQRTAFGRPIAGHGAFLEKLAEARIALDGARLVVLDAAATLDAVGNKQVGPPRKLSVVGADQDQQLFGHDMELCLGQYWPCQPARLCVVVHDCV